MKYYSIIIGIQGKTLSTKEINYLKNYPPIGIILFKRNIQNRPQTKLLVASIKKILGKNILILIDQEGGKVSRLNYPNWPKFPETEYFGSLASKNINHAKKETYNNYFLIGTELRELGINYNCAPVLDLKFDKANSIIGTRSFSKRPDHTAMLGYQACKGLLDANVIPILKHIPGHGRAKVDSHHELPVIKDSAIALEKSDFYPFKKLNKFPAVMTAHIKFSAFDKNYPVTHSKKIIDRIIRKYIGFKGVIFSDDICMKALKGNYFNRARLAVEAGCDLILKCDYNLSTTLKASKGSGLISKSLLKKLYNM